MSLRLALFAFISSTVLFNRRSVALVSADIVISEIAGKGSSNVCGEEDPNDWIELHNTATNASVSLAGYILHDDNGIDDATAFTFPPDYQALEPGEYRLVCTKGDDVTTSPQFAIGGDDTIFLVASDRSTVVASVGPLPDTRNEFDITYAWDLARGSETGLFYTYTDTPTPGLPNVVSMQQQVEETLELLDSNNYQTSTTSVIIISEIASKGTSNACNGSTNDWIELHNTDTTASVDLAGYILHDDDGMDDAKAFTFPPGYDVLQPGQYRVICTKGDNLTISPQFSIGGDDTVTLVASDRSTIVASVGPLPGTQDEFNITYAWNPETNAFSISSTPTPGLPNILSLPAAGGGGGGGGGETMEEIKQRLAKQNEKGTKFFGMDPRGLPVDDALDDVLDFHLTMKDDDYKYMMENKFFEMYAPFETARLVTVASLQGAQEEILSIKSPGLIRPKGQSSLYMGACVGSDTIPFQVEFDPSETLFGVEEMYLRNHFLDPTYARDWTMNRLLARFGLPHLRSRKVRFYINGDYIGFYTVVEAIDQEYVFARSFPDYDPFSFALYKWKIEAIGCGRYDPDQLADAATRLEAHLEDPSLPYSFERGDHRIPPPTFGNLGKAAFPICMYTYTEQYFLRDIRDVATLYLKYNEDCGEMLVEEGLMDRDLGTSNWDEAMKRYINKYLTEKLVSGDSEMDQHVDLESFLKTTAMYAVMLSQDSPLGTTNNYYMAQTGDGKGFKLLSYDHNIGPGSSCPCGDHMINWSIARPTCAALEFNRVVGPLLLKPELHARYLDYVRDFIEQAAGKSEFLEEINNHVKAIYRYVRDDYWYVGGEFPIQFSMDGNDWDHSWRQPIVPFLVARVEDVREQLKAIDAGTLARGLHQVEPYETCVDWRNSTPPPEPVCYNDCLYEGCYMNYWEVTHKCIEETATCVHGTYDIECRGIPEGEQYPGMESPRAMTGLETFCMRPYGLQPIKASVCPPPPPPDQDMLNFNYWYKVNLEETSEVPHKAMNP